MSTRLCSVCGRPLIEGACPLGHPQRSRRHGRRSRRLEATAVLILLLTAVVYAGLIWYPRKAATDFARPVSRSFAEGLGAFRAAVGVFPPGATDPQVMVDAAGRISEAAGPARDRLSDGRNALEVHTIPGIPLISSRPPLDEARRVQSDLATFYPAALEVVSRLERVADYLGEIDPALASVDELVDLLFSGPVVEEGTAPKAMAPAADVVGFMEATDPPEEAGGLHAALLAIATEIREGVQRLAGFGESSPVAKAVLNGVREDLATFRDTLGRGGVLVRRAGLGRPLSEAKAAVAAAVAGLTALRDEHGITGLSVPEVADPAGRVAPD
jgi:hypothetical protein